MSRLKTLFRVSRLAMIMVLVVGASLLGPNRASAAVDCDPDPAIPLKCFCEEARDNDIYKNADVAPDKTGKTICQLNDTDTDPASDEGLLSKNGIVHKVFNLLSWLTGLLAAVYLIIGGAKIITSRGSSDSVASGRKMIIFALVGIVVVISSNLIINFVIGLVNNASK